MTFKDMNIFSIIVRTVLWGVSIFGSWILIYYFIGLTPAAAILAVVLAGLFRFFFFR